MHTYLENDVFLDHKMKLCKMIEIYLKYDNLHSIRTINVFIWINNHVNSCINSMLSCDHSHKNREYSLSLLKICGNNCVMRERITPPLCPISLSLSLSLFLSPLSLFFLY